MADARAALAALPDPLAEDAQEVVAVADQWILAAGAKVPEVAPADVQVVALEAVPPAEEAAAVVADHSGCWQESEIVSVAAEVADALARDVPTLDVPAVDVPAVDAQAPDAQAVPVVAADAPTPVAARADAAVAIPVAPVRLAVAVCSAVAC